jgi:prepilin peptidase CpaA
MLPVSNAVGIAAVATATVTAAIIDLRTRRVPNALTAGIAVVGVGLAASGLGRVGLLASIAGCLLGFALMLPGHLIGATGGGDVKLLAAVGTLLGPGATLRAFVATAIAGGLIAIVVAVRRGRLAATLAGTGVLITSVGFDTSDIRDTKHDNRFAYAPAIAVGAIVAALI